ncbi:hypothetical protein MFUM_880001 [Methylacidiphilum fumariolicum SolV]|uniref:Uncharacterized protein n=2 Tax=Candidatus Methylacidiphilum fumarolicum TaxID=591154 RepID=I0K0G5_METFB|nr:conserved protein of unknown function [Candidatus Methylacidiphilum fumarolicum]CCG92984.1 hypothetical protein MFUM_880001 [Methylacidiphilum fumariolicum SolV]
MHPLAFGQVVLFLLFLHMIFRELREQLPKPSSLFLSVIICANFRK